MNRLEAAFKKGRKTLIAYVTVGYPSLDATLKVVPLLERLGCDIIELGIPFSDPLADGATIQQASDAALKNGVTPKRCLEVAKELGRKTEVPLVFMSYYNPLLHYGLESFCHASWQAGVAGLIIPDLPPEEGRELESASRQHGLDLIYLLAPTSTEERIRLVAEHSRGFIYLVSTTGTTGARAELSAGLAGFVGRVRKITGLPLCVGFGISTPEQAREVAEMADGVIIGSRIVQLMKDGGDFSELGEFISEMRRALDK